MEANEGLKKRNMNIRGGLKIDNDYANLMYQVRSSPSRLTASYTE